MVVVLALGTGSVLQFVFTKEGSCTRKLKKKLSQLSEQKTSKSDNGTEDSDA